MHTSSTAVSIACFTLKIGMTSDTEYEMHKLPQSAYCADNDTGKGMKHYLHLFPCESVWMHW